MKKSLINNNSILYTKLKEQNQLRYYNIKRLTWSGSWTKTSGMLPSIW